MIIEIDKKYLKEEYNGNIKAAIQAGDFLEWNPERIKKAFNFGNGAKKDFDEYKNNNKNFSVFLEV